MKNKLFKAEHLRVGTAFLIMLTACSASEMEPPKEDPSSMDDTPMDEVDNNQNEEPDESSAFFYGADLSYVNEMEDCGAIYYDENNSARDPYGIFKEAGANLVRLRLWHNPTWTDYSNFEDVKKSIQRAKTLGMQVLLDFHYSDTWTDPAKQEIPAAWIEQIDNTEALGDLLYDYTYEILNNLANDNLLPEIVQVGNEINPMILQQGELEWPIDWDRNSSLLNRGIKAVRDIAFEKNVEIGVMLHIAQPENALWWFEQATIAGVTDYDWIGLSYYPIWSDFELDEASQAFSELISTYSKRLMIVETAYPYTLENADNANNILGSDALVTGFPATPEGQLGYLNKLKKVIQQAGGEGLVYWEPAWVSTGCSTQWAQGSHWDNATLFDHNYKVTKGMEFYNANSK
ncbi:MAG: glycosyl hydrolase 53 family protein [Pricia sp.]